MSIANYTEDNIKSLSPIEHVRSRPGMYIGKLGDGKSADDGIYVLLKEVLDNSVDEYMMGFGKVIDIHVSNEIITVRDYGRGIPLGKLVDVVSKMNTGGKYDSRAFKKSVGLNGVGTKAVNFLSKSFKVIAYRENEEKWATFGKGKLIEESKVLACEERNGTFVSFTPDETIFKGYNYNMDHVESMIKNYVYLNAGLTININGHRFYSKNGLLDLLTENMNGEPLYPIIHLEAEDIEIAITHGNHYGEEYYSFTNGQHTTQGGSHLLAFREGIVKTIREFYGKNFDPSDVRTSIVAAINLKVEEPIFESQTKTKLGSKDMEPDGRGIRNFVIDFLKKDLDNHLHKNADLNEILLNKIIASEKERKAISGVKKIARERAKKVSLHNKKLRDCKIHFNTNKDRNEEASIFITEGDSASGSITKARDVQTQAVFSLKGKPLNAYGLTKKIVYTNEEFNLLQAALNIEDGLENLRYNKVIIATDADVDGMHIRLLLITFFLQFFPDLIKNKNLYILETPLFRVRNKSKTFYCYSDEEKKTAMQVIGKAAEITRFKGLGEISPNEFAEFIGEHIKLDQVSLKKYDNIEKLLEFYMGKNTPDRQEFIVNNLKIEEEI